MPFPARFTRCLLAGGSAALMTGAAAIALATSVAANPPGRHDPIGQLRHVTAAGDGVRLQGWAADPDVLIGNVRIYGLVDGKRVAKTRTSVPRPAIAARRHTGPTPGFDLTVRVPSGVHAVCAAVHDRRQGLDRLLGCVATPLGTPLTKSERAAHSPTGELTRHVAHSSSMAVAGWVREPDFISRRSVVVLYVDGSPAATVDTSAATASQISAGSGPRGAFRIRVPVSTGAHIGCVWAVDIGFGKNTLLGCRAVDTRGRPGTGTVRQPAANKTVVQVAKRQIGKPYVWDAAGPHSFDCSGLVLYSYGKAGVHGMYHLAAWQFNHARRIPASRVVPGDLVFYHTSEGYVHHVGIVTGPGMSVAAIDTQEGVNYQPIYAPDATYGSFTHT